MEQDARVISTWTQLMVGGRHVMADCRVLFTFFTSWHEPVLRVMVMAGAITTAGFIFAGVRVAGAQYLAIVHVEHASGTVNGCMLPITKMITS